MVPPHEFEPDQQLHSDHCWVGVLQEHMSEPHLQRHVTALRGDALQRLVVAAASAAFQHHAGRDVRVFRVPWVLLENVHQGLPGLADTLDVNLVEGENYRRKTSKRDLQALLI